MNFYDNLKHICDKKGLKVTPTVLNCGGTKGILSGWKNGTLPNSDIVMKLSVLLNVPTDYLLFGKEKSSPLSSDEQELLTYYKRLPEKERIRLISRAETLAEMYSNADAQVEEPAVRTIKLSCSENRVSAGFGDELSDYEHWDTIEVVETPISRKADFILVVDGDSMMPKFSDGDHVLIRQQPAVDIGQIGIFYIDGRGYIKKFEGDHLVSLNPQYEDILLKDTDFKCFGLVLGVAELA